jgi:lipoprotein-releasing system ATP-binding protein
MILVKNISKTYNNKKVVNKIDLNVKKGEIISITGPSGAGKTTLLNLISTLDSPDKNNDSTIKINDIDILSLNDKKLSKFRNTQIGFIFQFHELLPEFTALENVIIPAIIKGEKKDVSLKKAKTLLETLGLFNDPKVIFADEPSGNLDSKSSDLLHKLFFDLRDKLNITFIIVTHNKELSNMTDRKLNLVDGKWA